MPVLPLPASVYPQAHLPLYSASWEVHVKDSARAPPQKGCSPNLPPISPLEGSAAENQVTSQASPFPAALPPHPQRQWVGQGGLAPPGGGEGSRHTAWRGRASLFHFMQTLTRP